jgi:hypothetical protein
VHPSPDVEKKVNRRNSVDGVTERHVPANVSENACESVPTKLEPHRITVHAATAVTKRSIRSPWLHH